MDRALLDAYAAQSTVLRDAVRGLTQDQLRARPGPGAWSIHELVVHVMDSDLICAHRMRRIIAEDKPLLLAYDENKFIERLDYHETDVGAAAELFRLTRDIMAPALRQLPPEAFDRAGVHDQRGLVTLREMVELYVWHVNHHLKFLEDKKRALGVK